MPKPLAALAFMTIVSRGVGTHNQPLSTLKLSSITSDLAPAPATEALTPAVPAAPFVFPVICDTGSSNFNFLGVAVVSVGNAVTCVRRATDCCALVAFAACEIHARRNSSDCVVPGLTKAWARSTAPVTVTLSAPTLYSLLMMFLLRAKFRLDPAGDLAD